MLHYLALLAAILLLEATRPVYCFRHPGILFGKCRQRACFGSSCKQSRRYAKPTTTSSSTINSVLVHDNVFSLATCVELHTLAKDHMARNCKGSVFFRTPTKNKQPQKKWTPIEQALNSYLTAVGDPNEIVEYWTRSKHIHIDVHADVDELQLLQDGRIRCPQFGHVLYLLVGYQNPQSSNNNDESTNDHSRFKIVGPTCVFPSKLGGWSTHHEKEPSNTIVTVPAVQGRVLRFPGSAMHAVPKPAHRFLMSDEEERVLLEQQEQLINIGGDDDEEGDDTFIQRSVILFNTWAREIPGGVTEDYTMKDARTKKERIDQWTHKYGQFSKDLWCQSRSQWNPVPIQPGDTSSKVDSENFSVPSRLDNISVSVRIPLMGDKERRCHPKKNVHLSSMSSLRSGLEDTWQPKSFQLQE